jgi:hypothetical protein
MQSREPAPPSVDLPYAERQPSALLHTAYYAALAALDGREGSPQWRRTVAGLVTLRLVDRWIANSQRHAPLAGWTTTCTTQGDPTPDVLTELVEAASPVVAAVESGDPLRPLLLSLLDASATGARSHLAQALLAYAHALHADAQWPLAADVYETVHRLVAAPQSRDRPALAVLEPIALERLGHSLRMMGDLDGAAAAYTEAVAAARASSDPVRELRVRISEANLLIHVGNLPAAATALDAIIAEASRLADVPLNRRATSTPMIEHLLLADIQISPRDVLALARQDRGVVATMQGDFSYAIEQSFSAWRGYRDPVRRERVWCDLARALADIGLRRAAHDAYLVLQVTARERDIQLIAATNLLELAVIDEQPEAFASYCATLDDAAASGTLPAWLAPWAAFYRGMGEARFGRPDQARVTWHHALALATRARVNEVIIRVDAALAALDAGRALDQPPTPSAPVAASIEHIVRVVRRVRMRITEPWPARPATAIRATAPTAGGDRKGDPPVAPTNAFGSEGEPTGVDSHGQISRRFPR